MRRILIPLTALLAVLPAASAQASWFPATAVDGPADIQSLGDVDLARDGDGGVVYVKSDGGVPQLFLSRIVGGVPQPPERITSGPAVTEGEITATDSRHLAIAWIAGGDVLGTVVDGSAAPRPPAVLATGAGASGLTIDMGIDNVAYAAWAQAGGGGSDVHAARLDGNGWQPVPGAVDFDAARSAGTGTSRPRIAVSADGNAVVTWGEAAADGRNHVYARRLTGLTPSASPQDLTLSEFEGGAGGNADSPDIDIEDDGSYAWVAFRQEAGGRSRSVARRLIGSLFDPPFAIDAGQTSADPRIDFSGGGIGAAVAGTSDNATFSSYLDKFNVFQPATRIDQTPSGTAPTPVVATSERGESYAAWRTGAPDGSGAVHARRKEGEAAFEPEFTASDPNFGAVAPGQFQMASDRLGNVALAMLQGGPGARRLTVAVYDRPPGRPIVLRSFRYRGRKPLIKWQPGTDNWGAQTFTVKIDGKAVGRTKQSRLPSKKGLRVGLHRYQVLATDFRGQTVASRVRTFRVDPFPPSLRVSVTHSHRTVRVHAVVRERGPSGFSHLTVDFGDGSHSGRGTAVHTYRKPGRYTITVRAYDRADNVTTKRFGVRAGG